MKKHVEESLIVRAFRYCTSSLTFLALILILFFIIFISQDFHFDDITDFIISLAVGVIFLGYCLQITNDIINYGKRLPKIQPKKVLIYGVKGLIVFNVYFIIQGVILHFIAMNLNFPTFELDEALLSLTETIKLFYTHNPLHTTIFIILSLLITYITVFFMEMALAQIADDGKLINSFNPKFLKEIIDRIGWKKYIIDYTIVIVTISLLSFMNVLAFNIPYLSIIIITFLGLMIFVIEFGAIGLIYRENKE